MDCRLKNQVQATQEVINMTDSAMSKMQKGKEPKIKNKKASDGNRMNADGTAQTTAYYPKLTKKQRTLPEGLKKKIIEAKKSGAGYSGD